MARKKNPFSSQMRKDLYANISEGIEQEFITKRLDLMMLLQYVPMYISIQLFLCRKRKEREDDSLLSAFVSLWILGDVNR